MKEQMTERLKQLRSEQAAGLQQLSSLEERIEELRHTLLRISGAIQVLEEMLETPPEKQE